MRRLGLFAVTIVSSLTLVQIASAQDFDPNGRHRPKGGNKGNGNKGGHVVKPLTTNPVGDAAPASVLIERYTRIVLSQPGAPFPLQRLAQLYRERDGNLKELVADFEKRAAAAGADQYAAAVTLAGVYKNDGRGDDAIKQYEKAITLKPTDPSAIQSLARLYQDRGDTALARAKYEDALKLQTAPAEKEQTVRTLMMLALDGKDWAAAKSFHKDLVKLQPTSLFVKGELGKELYSRNEFERAEGEFKELVQASQGDNRTLAPALKDLGRAQAKAHKPELAIATLKKALAASGSEAAVRKEIYETITEIYRADQKLALLIKEIEAEHPSDFARLALLGSLYEETGDSSNALKMYERALAISPKQIDLRIRVIRLLQSQGELDKAITAYEGLIRVAPNNPEFVFEQCEALLQRGERPRAERLLTQLEARAQNDEEILSRLADFYARVGQNERSVKILTRLTQISSSDPSHLVELGDRYFQDGNTPLALATWKRILTTIQPRAKALVAYGDVLLEHDLTADAIIAYKEAVALDPTNLNIRKQLAGGYERTRSYKEASALWDEISQKARKSGDKVLAREARTHIVTLWGFSRLLEQQQKPLAAAFATNPPDVESGRLLAEVQMHLRKFSEAEVTLRKVVELQPGDTDAYLSLERVLVQSNKIQEAIAVLEKLVAADPKRARELYQRMAQYALQIYKDDDAIKYAARAVELNPDDAEGHRRLGEMYRSKQDTTHAIAEFRAAITKNDRLFIVYFELAEILLAKGETDEADRLFRRVLRGAPDEELIGKAARLSMQINLGKGTLEVLEQDLLPLSIGNPQRPIFRRLLVEVYGNLTFGLVQRERGGDAAERESVRAALAHIGGRAIKPLLDALSDTEVTQQRIAIDVLGYVENKNASIPLFSYATGPADLSLRSRAMLACGALRDVALLPKLESLLKPKDGSAPSDPVSLAAAWGVARLGDKRTGKLLSDLAGSGTPEMRAIALLGMGSLGDRSMIPRALTALRGLDGGPLVRAAAAHTIGRLGGESEVGALLAVAATDDPLPRQVSLLALGNFYGSGRAKGRDSVIATIADALFFGAESGSGHRHEMTEHVESAAASALTLAANGGKGGATDPLADLDGELNVEKLLWDAGPRKLTDGDREKALTLFAPFIERAAKTALQTSQERAEAVLVAFGTADGTLAPLYEGTNPEARKRVLAIREALEPAIVTLVDHPDGSIRAKALNILARSKSPLAAKAIVRALSDSDETIQRMALSSVGSEADSEAGAVAERLLKDHKNWSIRVLAAEALGRLGRAGLQTGAVLSAAAHKDSFAIVREACLKALAEASPAEAKVLARELAEKDPETHVRETARALLK